MLIIILVFVILIVNISLLLIIPGMTGNVVSVDKKSGVGNIATNSAPVNQVANKTVTTNTASSSSGGFLSRFFGRSSSGGSSSGGSSGGSSSGGGSGGGSNPPELIGKAKVYIEPAEINKAKNEELGIYVKIDTELEIYAVQFDLVFDKNILEALNMIESEFLKKDGASTYPIIKINNTLGKIEFADTRFNTQSGIRGQGILAEIKFKTKSSGLSNLNLENVKILNSNLQQINISLTNSKVVVG